MKAIENKILSFPKDHAAPDIKTRYSDLILQTLDIIPTGAQGFSHKDLRERARIESAVLATLETGTILLEDADFVNLQKIVALAKYTKRDKELLGFMDYIESEVKEAGSSLSKA